MSRVAHRAFGAVLLLRLLMGSTAAEAQEPQELEQLELGWNEIQLEYQGLFVPGDHDAPHAHAISVSYGVSTRLILGMELEGEQNGPGFSAESLALSALYRLTPHRDDALNFGLKLALGVGKRGKFDEVELRLIAERLGTEWWLQGNLVAEYGREDGHGHTTLSYVSNASRRLGSSFWLGLEASGAVTGFSSRRPIETGHFMGPSTSMEFNLGKASEIEIGAAYLARFAGEGPTKSARIFVQMKFD